MMNITSFNMSVNIIFQILLQFYMSTIETVKTMLVIKNGSPLLGMAIQIFQIKYTFQFNITPSFGDEFRIDNIFACI